MLKSLKRTDTTISTQCVKKSNGQSKGEKSKHKRTPRISMEMTKLYWNTDIQAYFLPLF